MSKSGYLLVDMVEWLWHCKGIWLPPGSCGWVTMGLQVNLATFWFMWLGDYGTASKSSYILVHVVGWLWERIYTYSQTRSEVDLTPS